MDDAVRIQLTLLEAALEMDSRDTYNYLKEWLKFEGLELLEELYDGLGEAANKLLQFVDNHPNALSSAHTQKSEFSWYLRRSSDASELKSKLFLYNHFEIFRVVNNHHYLDFCHFSRVPI